MATARALQVAVIRPYAALPSDGAVNDRYVFLCRNLLALGAAPRFFCSDFVHNFKQRRSPDALAFNAERLPFLRQIRSIAYRSNISAARIAHEGWFGAKVLWSLARGSRADVIVVGEPLFFVGWMAIAYGLIRGVPVLADINDLWPEADTGVRSGLRGASRALAYRALILSRNARLRSYRALSFVSRSYAERLAPQDQPPAIFYLCSQLAPAASGDTPGDPLIAIYAGSLGLGYDIETLLEAAAILRDEKARVRIIIAGSGPKQEEAERAQRDGTIDYLGQIDQAELIAAYSRADIGLLPYKAGSVVAVPNKFFDYVNFGLFIVSSLTMEVREIIEQKRIGLSFAPGDAQDLAAKLIAVSKDRHALDSARAASKALAREFAVVSQYQRFARFVLDHAEPPRD
jgi:glycosyltransferase involved in cell wall biosynthesis